MKNFKKAAAFLMMMLLAVSAGFQTEAFAGQCELCAKASCKENCACHGTENCGACKGSKS